MTAQSPFAPFFKAYTDMANACAFNSPENNPFGCAPGAALQQGYENARRNYQAASNAARAFADMTQTVARRQAEFAQHFVEACSCYLQEISACRNPQDAIQQNARFARQCCENAVSNGREVADIVCKSNCEVAEILNNRFSEALSDVAEAADRASRRAAGAFNTAAQQAQNAATGSNPSSESNKKRAA
ncbi:MAG: TIGR01841 family phasin [Rickettsiales bacterium]